MCPVNIEQERPCMWPVVASGCQRRVMTGHLLPQSWNWGSLVSSHQGILGVIIITSRTCPLEQTIQLLYECVLWNNKWQLQSWHQAATNNFQQHKLTASICLWSYEHAGRSFRGTLPVFLSGILAMKVFFFWKGYDGRVLNIQYITVWKHTEWIANNVHTCGPW